ncbi:MAG: S19 family ribosomal protein [Candidatus Hodgkinia cicadicola]
MFKVMHKLPYAKLDNKTKRKTWSRRTVVDLAHVGATIELHNGKRFVSFKVTNEMIGHKLGEFVQTRKQCLHSH